MPQENVPLLAFNRGVISPLALARTDLKRTALSAETQTNFMPRVLGSMMLRPGRKYLGSTHAGNRAYFLQFVFSRDDEALIEFTNTVMRVWIDDAVLERQSVSTVVANGDFSAAGSWTDADESGATSTIGGNTLSLVGTGYAAAIRKQEVTVAVADQGVEHALRIIVDRGPVTLRVGSTDGDDDYVSETEIGTGTHSLAFTPTGNFWIRFSSTHQATKIVSNCQVEASGPMTISTPYLTADLRSVRYDQSADVVFLGCAGYQPRKIERRGTGNSWSLVLYEPETGPFGLINATTTSLTPSALTGSIVLTASRSLFTSGNVGSLYRLTSIGQRVELSATGEDQWTDEIKVVGVDNARQFTLSISGTWTATVTLQRSIGEPGAWVDVTSYTGNTTVTYDDTLDNQTIYYRIGIKTGGYTSGTAVLYLSYANGGLTGVVRVTGYTSATEVNADVLSPLGSTSATTDWYEGQWSERRGYPSCVALHEGRLCWAGKGNIWVSISDEYYNFDDTREGDSAPINRSIGGRSVDHINWILSLSRLLIGSDVQEWSARSSSLDEPLTVTNFQLKSPSTQGSADVMAIKLDDSGYFVQSGGEKLYRLSNNSAEVSYGYGDYASYDLCELAPEIGQGGILRMQAQRQPDTRIHCLLADGTVAILISQPAEEVLCWVKVTCSGTVEDIVILPGDREDKVYYQVAYTINGSTVRYLERWAEERDCVGGTLNHQADSYIIYSGAATTTITGLSHLEGEEVVVWGAGKDLGTYTVSGGQITGLTQSVTGAIVGLGYTAQFKSAKLAYAAALGTALTQKKRVHSIGVILANTHYAGLQYGPDFDSLDDLPQVEAGAVQSADTVHTELETDMFEFDGRWESDPRLCLQAAAPRPCTVLAAVVGMTTNG